MLVVIQCLVSTRVLSADGGQKSCGQNIFHMNIQDNYSAEDWETISLLPSVVGAAAACAGTNGLFGMIKESMSSVQTMLAGAKMHPDNQLIKAVSPDMTDRQAAKQTAMAQRESFKTKMKNAGIKKREDLMRLALDEAMAVTKTLPAGASEQEIAEFKEWIQSIAQKVAESAKEGGFLGFGGTAVSEGEQQFLNDLKLALG